MALSLTLNGAARELPALTDGASLAQVIAALELKADRVAVEHNGEIARRDTWESVRLNSGDKLEVVHFVGGGSGGDSPQPQSFSSSVVTIHNMCYQT